MSGPIPDNALLAWLQDEHNDPFSTSDLITGMYTHFSAARPNPIDALQQDDRNHCFLIFVEDSSGESHAQVLHHLAQYPARLGAPASAYDRHWYLTLGQPIGGSMITVDLPGDMFALRNEAQVYSPDRIQRELANNPDATQLEVDENEIDNDDVETIITRRGMWLPNAYVALCLGEQLTPVDIWNRLYNTLVQNGHLEACSPLIKFLQYQLLGSDPDNHAIYQEDDLTQPNVSPSFLRHRSEVLSDLVPASAGNTPAGNGTNGNNGSGLSAADLQALIAALRSGHTAPAPAATVGTSSSSTTVDKRWAVNLDSLRKYCMVQDVNQLTPIWASLAKGPKKEERTILQAALDDHARSPGAATAARLTVTKELLNTVVGLVFWSGDLDMLEEGLHPFRTLYTSTTKQAQDQAKLRLYDSLAQGGNLRLEDVELFQLVLRSHWPSDYRQLDTSIRFFQNLITVLLSSTHPLVTAHKNFLKSWSSLDIQLGEYFANDQAKPALFLRSLQLRIATYWQQVSLAPDTATAALIPAPDFQALLSSLLVQSWVKPTMPGITPTSVLGLDQLPHPAIRDVLPTGAMGNPAPAPAPAPAPSPAPAPAPAPSPAPAARQTDVQNPSVHPEVAAAMEGRTFRIAGLFDREHRPPKHDDGRDMCCAYHVRGRCSSNCSRRYSHVNLSEAESTRLRTFVQERVVARNVGASA